MRSFNVLFSLIVLVLETSAFADNQQQRQGPPPEALEACQNKSVGTACTFTGMRGESLTGTCMTPDSSKPVACCPTNGPRGGGQPPGSCNGQSSGSNQNQRQN